jgi:PAS domain S-box-containing protein
VPPPDIALRAADEADRLAVVRSLGVLDAPREERFDKVARVLAAVLQVPVAFVSVMDEDALLYRGCEGLGGAQQAPRDTTFCAHTVVSGRMLVVPDLAADPRFRDNAHVTDGGFRFYAGQPLRVQGHVVGTLCALDVRPRELPDEQRALLADLAAWAEGELVSVELSRVLDREREGATLLAAVQQRDELILQAVDQAVYGIDPEGFVTFANPAAARLLGEDVEDLVGRDFHATYHATRADGSASPWEECPSHDALTRGVRRRVQRDLVHRRDGTPVEVELTAVPLDVGGEVVGAVVTLSDISARRAVERLKDEFVSVVSHELRTPLTSIRGSLGLLASGRFGELPAQGGRLVDIALQNTERLVRLVNDILDLERIETGHQELHRRTGPLGPVLEAARDGVAGAAEARGVQVRVAGGDVVASVDHDLMVRALVNLAGNAVKFSPDGATVELEALRGDGEVLVQVRDTGRGIPEDKLQRVFERFEQVDASDARDKGGTGLGLAITRSIVERHGGTVSVSSQEGVGSTFTVQLPGPASLSWTPQVVLVDDDPSVVELLGTALSQLGVRSTACATAGEAVQLVRRLHPSLVVLDVSLEDGTGFDVVAALRGDPATAATPLVVSTVRELDSEERERLVLGPTRFAPKGVSGGDVVSRGRRRRARPRAGHRRRGRRMSRTVVLVDDEDDIREVAALSLSLQGWEVVAVTSGTEAVEAVAAARPDAVLLDVMMPGQDGPATLAALHRDERTSDVPVVFLTAKTQAREKQALLAMGAAGVLEKPFDPVRLGDDLAQVLGW